MITKNNILLLIISLGLFLTSCQEWLDVKPLSEVTQDDLFSTEDGYIDALNGVYISLGDRAVYGDNLTMSFLDVLGQNYTIPSDHMYIDLALYNYETEFAQNKISSIWNKSYNIIANCNNIIEHLTNNDNHNILTGNNYNRILGEATAIRAMMHFDLLRMFNAPYESSPDYLGIPYVEEYKKDITEQSTTTETLAKVIKDMKSAHILLDNDEIKSPNQSSYSHRENRINIYAVSALLARVNLYAKDYTNAALYANEVIESERFSLMDSSEILEPNDYTFYREHVFSLFSSKIGETSRDYFVFNNEISKENMILTTRDGLSDLYDGDDIRHKYWFDTEASLNGNLDFLIKYNRPLDSKQEELYTDPVLPLVKLPEMYLILAECQAWDHLPDAIQTINILRMNRKAQLLNQTADNLTFDEAIEKEYNREFYGEGQLFFYYKRKNLPIINGSNGSNIPMSDSKYTLPLPDDEVQFGGRVTN